ncbi:MAG: hypothetical protein IT385_30385 [Deltaproteobacteria bacterium]|nr:hypothetical protein [Deltaproteobacteria bacterium]
MSAAAGCGTTGGSVVGEGCAEGMTIVMGHCCWAGQTWSDGVGQCIGRPTSCPPGREVRDGGCALGGAGAVDIALPPGTRVKRGPDWKWEDQDQGGLGTVTRRSDIDDEWVVVRWDHGGNEAYRYGAEGAYDLEVVPDAPPPPLTVGYRVRPAPAAALPPDLNGEVVEPPVGGWVEVKWSDGTTRKMRVGAERGWDIVPVGPAVPAIAVGDRVRRGADWRWGDQDQGGMGTVIALDPVDPWVSVWWDHGDDNNYRWGQDDAFDVEIVQGATFPPIGKGWRVKPGPHAPEGWSDPSMLGNVVSDPEAAGKVRVRWDNGRETVADTGAGGRVEILPVRGAVVPIALGDRVRRGKHWPGGSEDQGGLGTVVRTPFRDGSITVRWDSGSQAAYRWGKDASFDVEVVADAAALVITNGTPIVAGPLCVVACAGRTAGKVVGQGGKGQVKVKWDDLATPVTLPAGVWGVLPAHGVDAKRLAVGDRVRRGPDWRWDDQDGDQPGIVIQLRPDDEEGWVRVRWDHGGENNYRFGADDAYDLERLITPK